MKQTLLARLIASATPPRRVIASLICMLMICSLPLSSMAQRRGAGERTERTESKRDRGGAQRDRHNNRRPEANKRPDGNRRPEANKRPDGNRRPEANKRPDGNRRPEANKRPVNTSPVYRPGADGHRPNAPKPGNNVKPGQNAPKPGHNVKPGNNNHRPGQNVRPSGPSHNWTPGQPTQVRPGPALHRPPMAPPPHPPIRPAHLHGYHRPVPPPAWRPGPRPLFSTVLGLTFGTALGMGIDALISNGYTVDGYTDDMVYVNDVVQLNMRWPFGVLQYSNGLLAGSEFTYSSDWRDLNRYNMAYARLSSLYGPPVSSYNRGGDLSATWWGPGGQYVTLRFDYRAPMRGANRYYTTLSFGI